MDNRELLELQEQIEKLAEEHKVMRVSISFLLHLTNIHSSKERVDAMVTILQSYIDQNPNG